MQEPSFEEEKVLKHSDEASFEEEEMLKHSAGAAIQQVRRRTKGRQLRSGGSEEKTGSTGNNQRMLRHSGEAERWQKKHMKR